MAHLVSFESVLQTSKNFQKFGYKLLQSNFFVFLRELANLASFEIILRIFKKLQKFRYKLLQNRIFLYFSTNWHI